MPSQDLPYSQMMISTSRAMTRISVALKSRPSMRVWYLPMPPNSASITASTRLGSQTISPEPRSGATLTTLKFVGTTISRRKLLNFCTFTPPMATSGVLPMKLNSPSRTLRAKRSLMTSIVGMRPRTIRSWLDRSYSRSPPLTSCAAGSAFWLSPVMPCNRASTSSWERICWFMSEGAAEVADQASRHGTGFAGP